MKIALFGRPVGINVIPQLDYLLTRLRHEFEVTFIFKTFYDFLKEKINISQFPNILPFESHEEIRGKADVMLSIGGDGTMLNTIALVKDSGIPILGINTGRLGFLASISKDEIGMAIDSILQGKFSLDRRELIKLVNGEKYFGDLNYALNEISIHKKDSASMIVIHAFLNGQFLNSYWADGLIISTPTGSTAYSLSCGGPIVVPETQNFVITPIAPHNLNVRPIVFPNDYEIMLKIEGRSKSCLIALDSRSVSIDKSFELKITKQDFKINLIKIGDKDFLSTIRNKLLWGLDLRN